MPQNLTITYNMKQLIGRIDMSTQKTTTIEQSRRLIKIGLEPMCADMHYLISGDSYLSGYGYEHKRALECNGSKYEYLPAWSLPLLLKRLPSNVKTWSWWIDSHGFLFLTEPNKKQNCFNRAVGNDFSEIIFENVVQCLEYISDHYVIFKNIRPSNIPPARQ